MKPSLQRRLFVSFLPLVVLIVVLGVAGRYLLSRLGNASNAILRENYDSVVAMVGLNEALERIDSSFQFAIHGQEDAETGYRARWADYERHLATEQKNITLPGERELADELTRLSKEYRVRGDRFYTLRDIGERKSAYFGGPDRPGLLARFRQIKDVSGAIREMNQRNMEAASRDAQATAAMSGAWLTAGIVGVGLLAALLAWWAARSVVRPLRELTRAAAAIGGGDLNQSVPTLRHDEIGELAETFNAMARQLREYRQSNLARLVRARKAAQATVDSFPDPVLMIDLDGRVEVANPAARALFGVSPPTDTQPGPPWQPPESLRLALHEAVQAQRPSLTESFDQAVSFRLHGEERSYLPQVRPIREPGGETLGAAVVLNDVTRFRLLDQYKSDLVATVSHELKTPLTSVRLAVHVLLEEAVGPLNPKQTELLVDARDNAERLLRQIEQLLALARLQQPEGDVFIRPEDPVTLLHQAAEAIRGRAEDKHVELTVEASDVPPVAVVPDRIRLALGNLLENAVTYTPPGGRVTLSAGPGPDGRITLCVADTGVGIPAQYLPHVFERFFRVPGQSEGGGTGLGLAIVKEIVTAHHGAVTCESTPGQGTVFRITLPVWAPTAVPAGGGDEQ